MNKADIIDILSEHTGVSYVAAELMLNALCDNIAEALKRNEKVYITGFGTFEKRTRSGHKCKNPRTGEDMYANAYETAVFRPSNAFKRKMAEEGTDEL